MARPFLRLQVIARCERHAALGTAADCISAAGGWVVDHTLFSDTMAVINFELPADRCGQLGRELEACGLPVYPQVEESLGPNGMDVRGQLNLLFAGGTGDLRRDVPAFH